MSCKYGNISPIYTVNLCREINIKIYTLLKHFSSHGLSSESNVQIYNTLDLMQFLKSGVCEFFEGKAVK